MKKCKLQTNFQPSVFKLTPTMNINPETKEGWAGQKKKPQAQGNPQ
jgi:hypothetical protein